MNEQVLEVIIKLQAIIAKVGGLTDRDHTIVEMFLDDHVNDIVATKYMRLFDDSVQLSVVSKEETARICQSINREITRKQKIFILLHLVELVLANDIIDEDEEAYMLVVCDSFNIEEEIYHNIKTFLSLKSVYDYPIPGMLIIDGKPHQTNKSQMHIYRQNLITPIAILQIPTDDMFIVRIMDDLDDLFLNGEILKTNHIYPLTVGSVVRGDNIHAIYYSEVLSHFYDSHKKLPLAFKAENIRYYFRNGKKGLHNINIEEESGNMVALMGASGSGKSTLLNVLNGNHKPQIGNVTINGINIYDNSEEIEGVIGYVPQDDLLIEDLTVFENLYYAARLCFDKLSENELEELVNKTLTSLGLLEIKELKVGNILEKTISGGQRKRVNIGLELLREPSVLFVDEPTSGLSSRDSENIMDLLRELALQGKLVFSVIHQPSSDIFKLFDRLIILDVGGYQIYYGNPVESLIYFKNLINQTSREQGECETCGNVNVEQVFNIIESKALDEFGNPTEQRKTSPEKWYKLFQQNNQTNKVDSVSEKPLNTLEIASKWRQFTVFIQRDLLAKLRNTQYLNINLLQAPFLAILLAFVVRYYDADKLSGARDYIFSENMNVPSFIFMSIIVSLFMGLVISAEEIIKDAKIVKREAFLHLNRHSYLLSKITILFGFSAFQTLTYVLIGNYIIGIKGMTLTYWAVLFSTSCFANMLGLNISASFSTVVSIYILIPLLLIPQLVLGGMVVRFDQVNPRIANKQDRVPLFGDLMAARWAFEALAVSQFKDNEYEKPIYQFDKKKASSEYKKVYYIPALQARVEKGLTLKSQGRDHLEEYIADLELLKNEISTEQELVPSIKFEAFDQITPDAYDIQVAGKIKSYLNRLRKYYNQAYIQAAKERDQCINQMIEEVGDRSILIEKSENYKNNRLTDLLTNARSEKRIVEYHDQLIQKIYPIYLDPVNVDHPFDYRTHFFAPTKHFMGYYIPTLYFNLGVLWFFSIFLYVTLYFNFLRSFLLGFSSIKKRLLSNDK